MKPAYLFVFCVCLLSFCTDHEDISEQSYPSVLTHPVTNITEEGAVFEGEVTQSGKSEIIDRGFVWGEVQTLSLETSDKRILGKSETGDSFRSEIQSTLEENKTYYVRAYIKTSKLVIYGTAVPFLSLGSNAPVITGFEPGKGKVLDTVDIQGTGFSFIKSKNEVKFGTELATIVSATDTLLRAIVPMELTIPKTKLNVSVIGNLSTSINDFELLAATITAVSSSTIKACDTLSISGSNFNLNRSFLRVKLNETECTVISNSENSIKITVPVFFPAEAGVTLKVVSSNIETTFGPTLTYKKPQFLNIVPRTNTTFNDTIVVKAKNLPRCGTIKVKLKSIEPPLVVFNDSTVAFKIPESLNESQTTLSISFEGSSLSFTQPLVLSAPKVLSVTPTIGTFNDAVTITGKNFHPDAIRNTVSLGGVHSMITSSSTTQIVTKVSLLAVVNKHVSVQVNELSGILLNTFTLRPPVITSISPSVISAPGPITLTGNYFNPQADLNNALIGNTATVISSTRTQIVANVDLHTVSNGDPYLSSSHWGEVRVETGGQSTTPFSQSVNFDYKGPWTQKADFPGVERLNPISFTLQNKLYIGMGQNSDNQMLLDLWEYNPTTNAWTQRANFPGSGRIEGISFVLNGKAYVGLGKTESFTKLKDIWTYNPVLDNWTRLNDFSGGERSNAEAFVINAQAFIVGGSGKSVWNYNSLSDSWSQLQDAPVSFVGQNNFVIDNKAFHIHRSETLEFEIHEYNSASDTWTLKLTSSSNVTPRAIQGGYIYDAASRFLKYDPSSNTLSSLIMRSPNRYEGRGADIQGKQYIFSGYQITAVVPSPVTVILNDFWEFDYSKYPH